MWRVSPLLYECPTINVNFLSKTTSSSNQASAPREVATLDFITQNTTIILPRVLDVVCIDGIVHIVQEPCARSYIAQTAPIRSGALCRCSWKGCINCVQGIDPWVELLWWPTGFPWVSQPRSCVHASWTLFPCTRSVIRITWTIVQGSLILCAPCIIALPSFYFLVVHWELRLCNTNVILPWKSTWLLIIIAFKGKKFLSLFQSRRRIGTSITKNCTDKFRKRTN